MEHISNHHFQVSIDELGAELSSIIKDGRERLWQGENGLWNKHAPILFPFAGLCRMMENSTRRKDTDLQGK